MNRNEHEQSNWCWCQFVFDEVIIFSFECVSEVEASTVVLLSPFVECFIDIKIDFNSIGLLVFGDLSGDPGDGRVWLHDIDHE